MGARTAALAVLVAGALAVPLSLEARTVSEEIQFLLSKRSPDTWILWGRANNTSAGEVIAFYLGAEEVARDTTLYDPENPASPFYGAIFHDLDSGEEIRSGTITGRPCPLVPVDGLPLIYRPGGIDNRDLVRMTETGIPEPEKHTTWGAIKALYR